MIIIPISVEQEVILREADEHDWFIYCDATADRLVWRNDGNIHDIHVSDYNMTASQSPKHLSALDRAQNFQLPAKLSKLVNEKAPAEARRLASARKQLGEAGVLERIDRGIYAVAEAPPDEAINTVADCIDLTSSGIPYFNYPDYEPFKRYEEDSKTYPEDVDLRTENHLETRNKMEKVGIDWEDAIESLE